MQTTVNFNSDALEAKVRQAFASYSQLLEAEFTKQITAKQFNWPTKTQRGRYNRGSGSKQTVGSPRDIIDSGAFRQSQLRTQVTPYVYRYSWLGYAAPIYFGYKTQAGNQMPKRDWITPALTKFPISVFMEKYLKS